MKELHVVQTIDEFGRRQGVYKSLIEGPYNTFSTQCYYIDGKLNGEYKMWYDNRTLYVHTYYMDGQCHGEYKSWKADGTLWESYLYLHGVHQTSIIPIHLSPKDKFTLTLQYGVQWL